MSDTHPPILIAGPTASGKSALALQLARLVNGRVINADALQVYECWSVLSARPNESELSQAPHALYGHVGKHTPYSTGHWLKDVAEQLDLAKELSQCPIIIGGTGLYFTALTRGLAEIPAIPPDIREQGNTLRETNGPSAFIEALTPADPETLATLDQKNPARLQRAWEVLVSTGKGLTAWHASTPQPLISPDTSITLLLDADRDWLAQRIDRRFDLMMQQGALAEVKSYITDGWDPNLPSAQAIGAPDLVAYLDGEISLDTAIENAKARSRQYAKRQRTWFRSKMKNWRHLDPRHPTPDKELLKIVTGFS